MTSAPAQAAGHPAIDMRRLARGVLAATAALVLLTLTGCGDDPGTTGGDSSEPAADASTTSSAPTSSEASTTTLLGEDCGTMDDLFGWPTTMMWDDRPGQCLADGFASGAPKHLTVIEQTDGEGGHPRFTMYEVIGERSVRRTVDATRSVDGAADVAVTTCTELTTAPHAPPTAGGCS